MPTFSYTARAANGELKKGTLDVKDRDEVVAQLKRQRLVVVNVKEESKAKSSFGGGSVSCTQVPFHVTDQWPARLGNACRSSWQCASST